jgi:hypothetical protein
MKLWFKMRAIVALAAAYAVVLQATLLAIGLAMGGPIAGSAGLAASSLCTRQSGAPVHPPLGGSDHGCLATCLACCAGISVPPASAPALGYHSALPQRIAVVPADSRRVLLRFARAHRSRAPPLG